MRCCVKIVWLSLQCIAWNHSWPNSLQINLTVNSFISQNHENGSFFNLNQSANQLWPHPNINSDAYIFFLFMFLKHKVNLLRLSDCRKIREPGNTYILLTNPTTKYDTKNPEFSCYFTQSGFLTKNERQIRLKKRVLIGHIYYWWIRWPPYPWVLFKCFKCLIQHYKLHQK